MQQELSGQQYWPVCQVLHCWWEKQEKFCHCEKYSAGQHQSPQQPWSPPQEDWEEQGDRVEDNRQNPSGWGGR